VNEDEETRFRSLVAVKMAVNSTIHATKWETLSKKFLTLLFFSGATRRIRTDDLLITNLKACLPVDSY
jgi:hypothetical protein